MWEILAVKERTYLAIWYIHTQACCHMQIDIYTCIHFFLTY